MPRTTPPLLACLFAAALSSCTFQGGGIAPFNPAPVAPAEPDLDVPYVPTPRPVVEAMLDLAELGPSDTLIDLGSGDGRIVVAAARRGARALGVDIDPVRVSEGYAAAQLAGVQTRATFRRQDIFDTPIREANVVTAYLLPAINLRLRPRLLTELRPGTRVVTHAFTMGDWQPDAHRVIGGRNIYLWIVPAVVGGDWTLTDGGATMAMALDQRFQQVTGTLAGSGRTMVLRDATLRGANFSFTVDMPAGPRTYRGLVEGDSIVPDPAGGPAGWRARRAS
ncbi:SAM-dependent methyltransferase [Sphingosinicella sp.]|uniref:SAM-dependent methyltransferase n=1 Tax=Sphingosinicella sp. TaxID=1917971 RepID=UPI004037A597